MITSFIPYPVLETEDLLIRVGIPEDDEMNLIIYTDPVITKYLGFSSDTTIDYIRERRENVHKGILDKKFIDWNIILKESNECIGGICIWNLDHFRNSGELGYKLYSKYHRRGYMTQALHAAIDYGFNVMGLSIIEAFTRCDNEPSIQLLLSNGFEPNGSIIEENTHTKEKEVLNIYQLRRSI